MSLGLTLAVQVFILLYSFCPLLCHVVVADFSLHCTCSYLAGGCVGQLYGISISWRYMPFALADKIVEFLLLMEIMLHGSVVGLVILLMPLLVSSWHSDLKKLLRASRKTVFFLQPAASCPWLHAMLSRKQSIFGPA